jgi:hypothetical protein
VSRASVTLAAAAAFAFVACADEVPLGSHLERTRVLAVSLTPSADPTRASARAGEEATLATLVAAPGALPPLTWHLEVCAADATGACTAAPFVSQDGTGAPEATFVVPAGATVLHVSGHLVPEGEPDTTFGLTLPVETSAAAPNHHPEMGDVTMPEGCVAAGGPDVVLRVATAASDRERYLRADGSDAREALRLSFFATAGELARQFASVAADDPDEAPVVEMKWTPPPAADVPPEGMDVTFVIVVRDLRGGVDSTERTVCVRQGKAE